jgi:hypothetical protein
MNSGTTLLQQNLDLRRSVQNEINLRHDAENTIAALRKDNEELRRQLGKDHYYIIKIPKKLRGQVVRAHLRRLYAYMLWFFRELQDLVWPPLVVKKSE